MRLMKSALLTVPAVLAAALGCILNAPVLAQTVSLTGMLGGKALLIVDGSSPKMVAVGESYKGVAVLSVTKDQAVVEIAGKQSTLRVGDTPANVGAGVSSNRIILKAGQGGHFFAQGQINGKDVYMLVDTGATSVILSITDAQRIGLNYQIGLPTQMSTANGVVPAWRVKLKSVAIGDVVVGEVNAVVSAGPLPFVLLGNSFLAHFQMTRTNEEMVLNKR